MAQTLFVLPDVGIKMPQRLLREVVTQLVTVSLLMLICLFFNMFSTCANEFKTQMSNFCFN